MALRLLLNLALLALALAASPSTLASDAPPARAAEEAPAPPAATEPEAQFPQERCVYVDVEAPSFEALKASGERPAPSATP